MFEVKKAEKLKIFKSQATYVTFTLNVTTLAVVEQIPGKIKAVTTNDPFWFSSRALPLHVKVFDPRTV